MPSTTPAGSAPIDAAGSAPAWRLCLLGEPCVVRLDPAPATHRLSPKDAALLAMVALDGPVSCEQIASRLWPGADRRKGDTNLRQRLFRMRRDLQAHLVHGHTRLELAADVETDWAASVARIATDAEAGREELLGALEFDDQPDLALWLDGARRRWRAQRDAALAEAAARCESTGSVALGLRYALRLVEADPLSEHAQRRVMRLHYLRGDTSAAIAAFEAFERRLRDELGMRPSAETLELLGTIERAAASVPARRAIVPASLVRPPRLVGRGPELDALARAWRERRVFLVAGEAGIGKSRLLQEFVAGSEGVVFVRAQPGDAGVPYALLARLLRTALGAGARELPPSRRDPLALILPELGPPPTVSGEAQRLLLRRAVEQTLEESAHGGLRAVVLDDLHFADEASVEALQHLACGDALAELAWGFAQRPADAGVALATLRSALEELGRILVVTLKPLGEAQIAELMESLALPALDVQRLAPALLRHTGGNPLFVVETLKDMLLAGVDAGDGRLPQPDTVGALVERRLAQLSPAALKLARAAALAGPTLSAELAAAILEVHALDLAEPWRELEAAHVIRDGAFAHDLVYEATVASVPEPIARILHARIAQHLEARAAPAAAIAPHWDGAREWRKAGDAHAAAARQARSASQRRHEVDHWEQARACYDRAGDADRSFDARCESVQALIVMRGVAQAQILIDALVAEAATGTQKAAALIARANAALMAVDHRTGIAAAREAAAAARAQHDDALWFEAERLHAVGLAQGGFPVEALAVIEPLKERIEAEATSEQKGRFWADYAYVLNTARRLRDTAAALRHAIDNATSVGDLAELATLTSNLATVQGNLGHVGDALQLAERALALQGQLGETDGPTGGVVETYVGLYCGMAGRYDDALQRLDAALERFRRDAQPLWIAVASNHKAQFLLELGQHARARQALDYEPPPVPGVQARGEALAARIERALGKRGDARLQRALELLDRGGDPHIRMQAQLDQAMRADPRSAAARCEEVMRTASQLEFNGVHLRAALLRTRALHEAGSHQEALAQLRAVLPLLERLQPVDMYVPDAWWIALQVFDANGADDEAMGALAAGTRWIRQVALPHVPEPFRESFLHRNETNRALLAAAGRRQLPVTGR